MLTGGIGNPVIATAELGGSLLMSLLALAAPIIALALVVRLPVVAVRRSERSTRRARPANARPAVDHAHVNRIPASDSSSRLGRVRLAVGSAVASRQDGASHASRSRLAVGVDGRRRWSRAAASSPRPRPILTAPAPRWIRKRRLVQTVQILPAPLLPSKCPLRRPARGVVAAGRPRRAAGGGEEPVIVRRRVRRAAASIATGTAGRVRRRALQHALSRTRVRKPRLRVTRSTPRRRKTSTVAYLSLILRSSLRYWGEFRQARS